MSIRVIVCGGRDYGTTNAEVTLIRDTLDDLHKRIGIALLVDGFCRGTDTWAHRWAKNRGIATTRVKAHWRAEGLAAGPKRNARMLAAGADLVVAFPGGRGTADMVRQARAAGVEVLEVQAEATP